MPQSVQRRPKSAGRMKMSKVDSQLPAIPNQQGVPKLRALGMSRRAAPASAPKGSPARSAAPSSAASPGVQNSYVEPSDVAVDVEELRDQVRFTREFEKVALEQRRSASEELEDKNQRTMQRRLEASKKKKAKLALNNKELKEELAAMKGGPMVADEKLARERLRVQNLQQNVAALKTERSGLVREARDAEEARDEAEGQLEDLRSSLDRAVGAAMKLEKQLAKADKKLKKEEQNSARVAMEHQAIVRTLASHKEEKSAVVGAKSALEEQWEQDRERHRHESMQLLKQVDAAQAETATLQEAYDDMATRYTVLKNRETKRKAIVKCEIGTQADLMVVPAPVVVSVPVAKAAAKESEALGASLATLEGLTAKTAQAAETAVAAASPAPRKAAAPKRASSLTVLRPSSPIWWAADTTSGPSPRALRSLFDAFDEDKSGTINSSELQKIFVKFGHTLSSVEVRCMLEIADVDGSGEVDFDEFTTIVSSNLRNELWYSAAKLVAVEAATTIQRAFAKKWPRLSRPTFASTAKMTAIAVQALKAHAEEIKTAGVAAARAQGSTIDKRLQAIHSKADGLSVAQVSRKQETQAATKIQSAFRGKRGRRVAKGQKRLQQIKQEDAAATKIQSVYRGRKGRKAVRGTRATQLRQKRMQDKQRSPAKSEKKASLGKENAGSKMRDIMRPPSQEAGAQHDRVRQALMETVQTAERTVLGRTGEQKPAGTHPAVLAKIAAFRLKKAADEERRRDKAGDTVVKVLEQQAVAVE